MESIALLGDSIFDNKVYVGGGPDVAAQLRALLPEGWRVTLCAVDGAMTQDIGAQLDGYPNTSHASCCRSEAMTRWRMPTS